MLHSMVKCVGCGALVEDISGANHKYFGESAGCWKIYGEVLAREYENANYWQVHRLTVDTYAAQHPFNRDRRNIQSVNIHLMALYAILELNLQFDSVPPLLSKAAGNLKNAFVFLEPPNNLGKITVVDIFAVKSAADHAAAVWKWARSVWAAWEPQHGTVKDLFERTQAL